MKADIHPKLNKIKVHCGCGNEFETLSVAPEMRVEICGACHPFYTGTKRAISATGRVQRFEDKYKNVGSTPVAKKAKAGAKKR
jgi:large subunit ribosomal protein L31